MVGLDVLKRDWVELFGPAGKRLIFHERKGILGKADLKMGSWPAKATRISPKSLLNNTKDIGMSFVQMC